MRSPVLAGYHKSTADNASLFFLNKLRREDPLRGTTPLAAETRHLDSNCDLCWDIRSENPSSFGSPVPLERMEAVMLEYLSRKRFYA